MNPTFKTSKELREITSSYQFNAIACRNYLPLTEAYEKLQTQICVDTPRMLTLNAEITQERDQLKAQLTETNRKLEVAKEALAPFCPGVEPINWGKIKAHLPTELAKQLTQFNVAAEQALTTLNQGDE